MKGAKRSGRGGQPVPVARAGLRRVETCAVGEELGGHGHQGALGLPGSAEPHPPQQDHALYAERRLDGAQEAPRAVAEDEPLGVGAAEVDLGGEGRRVRGEQRGGVVRASGAEPGEGDVLRRRLRPGTGGMYTPVTSGNRGEVWRRKFAGEQGGQRGDLLRWRVLADDLHKWVRGQGGTTAPTPGAAPPSEDVQWLGVHGVRRTIVVDHAADRKLRAVGRRICGWRAQKRAHCPERWMARRLATACAPLRRQRMPVPFSRA